MLDAFVLLVALLLAANVKAIVVPTAEQLAILSDYNEINDEVLFWPAPQALKPPPKIAIVGSGITGAVAAFKLSEEYRARYPPEERPSITVFERNPIVGGRITQAFAYNDPTFPVDTCAATFSFQDQCISQYVSNVGLTTDSLSFTRPRNAGTGIWNGERFTGFIEESGFRSPQTWSIFRKVRWFRRYGSIPEDFATNASSIRLSFNQVLAPSLSAPGAGFLEPGSKNFTKALETARLERFDQNPLCLGRELQYPDGKKNNTFLQEIITPGMRERFFDDRVELSLGFTTLEFYLGFTAENPIFVREGNLQLIERLFKLSTSDVRVNTEVQAIERQSGSNVQITAVPTSGGSPTVENFDRVILATSLYIGNITYDPPLVGVDGIEGDFRDSFVIHFTTGSQLNGSYFNLTGTMPQRVLTTYDVDNGNTTRPSFYSLTWLRELQRENPRRVENLYKLVSRTDIGLEEIEKYLTEPEESRSKITWIDRQSLPKSVPIAKGGLEEDCRTPLENFQVGPGIFYAGGGEQLVASAEMGCRFAENVANLILNNA